MSVSKKWLSSVPLLVVATLISVISCKESPSLPPKASHTFSSIKDWPFGQEAYIHTQKIVDLGPRPIESKAHKKVQDYISGELRKSGWVVTKQSFNTLTPYGNRNFSNLVARYNMAEKGRPEKTNSPKILLAAHYDSKMIDGFVGADDAASCVGALLEIAKHLPSQPSSVAPVVELVFFDGEEALKKDLIQNVDGIYGSSYYSDYIYRDLAGDKKTYQERPKFGILLDMIGHKDLSIAVPSDTPDLLLTSYQKIISKHGLRSQFKVAPGPILDDHVPMNNIANVPTIDLIGDFGNKREWWHTKNDNIDLISKESLSVSIQFALELMMDVAAKTKK